MILTPAVSAFVTQPRPCTHFAAAWLLSRSGLAPENPASAAEWAALDPRRGAAVNIHDASDPWSGVEAAGSLPVYGLHDGPSIELQRGRWHFVQRWNLTRTRGHAYMVMPLTTTTYRVLQSSESLGYRDTTETAWLPPGYDVGVARIPRL